MSVLASFYINTEPLKCLAERKTVCRYILKRLLFLARLDAVLGVNAVERK